MIGFRSNLLGLAAGAVLALTAVSMLSAQRALAKDGNAQPSASTSQKCTQFATGTKKWKRCMGQTSLYDDEDKFYIGLSLARAGDYAGALEFLRTADQSDARVLTYIGYATRKLGDIDGGMAFYSKALTVNPNYMPTREYLGEAYLQKGDLASAEAELAEIARRCGGACESYQELAQQIRYNSL